jgi:hypothetical protein
MRPLSRSSKKKLAVEDEFRGDSTAPRVNKVLDWSGPCGPETTVLEN